MLFPKCQLSAAIGCVSHRLPTLYCSHVLLSAAIGCLPQITHSVLFPYVCCQLLLAVSHRLPSLYCCPCVCCQLLLAVSHRLPTLYCCPCVSCYWLSPTYYPLCTVPICLLSAAIGCLPHITHSVLFPYVCCQLLLAVSHRLPTLYCSLMSAVSCYWLSPTDYPLCTVPICLLSAAIGCLPQITHSVLFPYVCCQLLLAVSHRLPTLCCSPSVSCQLLLAVSPIDYPLCTVPMCLLSAAIGCVSQITHSVLLPMCLLSVAIGCLPQITHSVLLPICQLLLAVSHRLPTLYCSHMSAVSCYWLCLTDYPLCTVAHVSVVSCYWLSPTDVNYYRIFICIFIKNVSIVSTKKELYLSTFSWKIVNV